MAEKVQWEKVEAPAPQFDSQFIQLEKGDSIEGWLLGTRGIRNARDEVVLRWILARRTENGTREKVILPSHVMLDRRLARLANEQGLPQYVRITNLGRTRLATGRSGFDYEVVFAQGAKVPPDVQAESEQLQRRSKVEEVIEEPPF